MLISADDQPNANGRQLEMASVQGLLQQALQQTEALAAAAKAAEAVTADYDRQKALLNESLSQLKKAGILISAPAGMALAWRTDLQCTAAENLIATAGGHGDFSIAKRFTLAAGELVSIFAQKLGIKLLAARGKVELQAQSDEMRLLADKHVTITSANGRVVIEAKDELLLKCEVWRLVSANVVNRDRRRDARRPDHQVGGVQPARAQFAGARNEHVEACEILRHLCPSESIDRGTPLQLCH